VFSEALSEVFSSKPFPFKGKAGMGMGFSHLLARFTFIDKIHPHSSALITIEDGEGIYLSNYSHDKLRKFKSTSTKFIHAKSCMD